MVFFSGEKSYLSLIEQEDWQQISIYHKGEWTEPRGSDFEMRGRTREKEKSY